MINMTYTEAVDKILKNIGGAENIRRITHCMTRLRFELEDFSISDNNALMDIEGVKGVLMNNSQLHIIIGREVEAYYNAALNALGLCEGGTITQMISNPISGHIVPLTQVPDIAYSSEILGKGYAVIPADSSIYAPFDGVIASNSQRSIEIISDSGLDLLINAGITTGPAEVRFFEPLFAKGSKVKKGERIMNVDINGIMSEGLSIIIPIVILNSASYQKITLSDVIYASAMDNILAII